MPEPDYEPEFELSLAIPEELEATVVAAFAKAPERLQLPHVELVSSGPRHHQQVYFYLSNEERGASDRLIVWLEGGKLRSKYSQKRWWGEGQSRQKYEMTRPLRMKGRATAEFLAHQRRPVMSALVKSKTRLRYSSPHDPKHVKARLDHMIPIHPADPTRTAPPFYDLEFESRNQLKDLPAIVETFLAAGGIHDALPPVRVRKLERAAVFGAHAPPQGKEALKRYVNDALAHVAQGTPHD